MFDKKILLHGAAAGALAILIAFGATSVGADILDDWSAVRPPPLPELKAVTLDGSTTALLILDLMKMNCGARPRCVASVPNVQRLHDAARKAGASDVQLVADGKGALLSRQYIPPCLTLKASPHKGLWPTAEASAGSSRPKLRGLRL